MSSQQLLNQLFCKVKIRPICLWKCIIKQEIYIVLKSCVPSRSKVSNWPKSLFGLSHSIYHCLFGTPYYVGRYFWGIMFIHFFVRKHSCIMQLNSFLFFLILYKCRIIWFYTPNNESVFWPEFLIDIWLSGTYKYFWRGNCIRYFPLLCCMYLLYLQFSTTTNGSLQ